MASLHRPQSRTDADNSMMKSYSVTASKLAALLLCLGPSSVHADAVIRSAAGATPADIQSAVDGFRTDLGGVDNGSGGGPFASGFRVINWDDVPDASAAVNLLSP